MKLKFSSKDDKLVYKSFKPIKSGMPEVSIELNHLDKSGKLVISSKDSIDSIVTIKVGDTHTDIDPPTVINLINSLMNMLPQMRSGSKLIKFASGIPQFSKPVVLNDLFKDYDMPKGFLELLGNFKWMQSTQTKTYFASVFKGSLSFDIEDTIYVFYTVKVGSLGMSYSFDLQRESDEDILKNLKLLINKLK